jgi:hypothetical protein
MNNRPSFHSRNTLGNESPAGYDCCTVRARPQMSTPGDLSMLAVRQREDDFNQCDRTGLVGKRRETPGHPDQRLAANEVEPGDLTSGLSASAIPSGNEVWFSTGPSAL